MRVMAAVAERKSTLMVVAAVAVVLILLGAGFFYATRPNVAAKPPKKVELIDSNAAVLYWKAIDEMTAHNDFSNSDYYDTDSPAGKHVIDEFRKASALPQCDPVA